MLRRFACVLTLLVGNVRAADFTGVGLQTANDVSTDGRVVVGSAANPEYSFYHTWPAINHAGVVEFVPFPPRAGSFVGDVSILDPTGAYAVTPDGSRVAGMFTFNAAFFHNLNVGFSWDTTATEADDVGSAGGFGQGSAVLGVSNDGETAVGCARFKTGSSSTQPIHSAWTKDGAINLLGTPEGQIEIDLFARGGDRANGVSADGTHIVGRVSFNETVPEIPEGLSARTAALWRVNGLRAETISLGDLPGGNRDTYVSWADRHFQNSEALAISDDAQTVVGWGTGESGVEAFKWTEESGMLGLGDLPGGVKFSEALAVSEDGSFVVGRSIGESRMTAFIWDAEHGMRSLADVLIAGGVDLTGWNLTEATGIAGQFIVGNGTFGGQHEAWQARLEFVPEPSMSGARICQRLAGRSWRPNCAALSRAT